MDPETRCARKVGAPRWLGLIVWVAIASPALAEGPKTARWVGADAVLYLEAPHPGPLLDRVLGESFQKALGAVPAYRRYLEGTAYGTTRAVLDQVAGKLDTTPEKAARDLTGGGVVLADEGTPGQSPRVILIVTPSDPGLLDRAKDAVLELARQDATAKGNPDPVKSGEHRGVTGYQAGKGAFAIVQGSLVIANESEALKRVVDRALDGEKAGASIADDARWKARRERVGPDAVAWGFARLDKIRELDPKRFTLGEDQKTPLTLFFGPWAEAIKKGEWASATVTWTEDRLGGEVVVPTPSGGFGEALKGFLPPKGKGAAASANPPGTIARLSLWRNLARIWESRTELFPPEVVQGLDKLDGVAGQFFGGRDFETGVLDPLGDDWRLVVARQDFGKMDPVPDQKLPAFALVFPLKPGDDDFPQRLKVAFQSFVGLANLGAAQSKAPPLELGSETVDGVTIATTRYMLPKAPSDSKEPVNKRHNFSPCVARVDDHFVLSSSLGLARDLIKALRAPDRTEPATLVAEADGPELARLLELNRERMVMQNMLEKGQDKAKAGEEVDLVFHLLRYLGHARLSVQDNPDAVQLGVNFALSK